MIFILYTGSVMAMLLLLVQRYAEKYPNRRVPSRQTFINVHQRFRETGSVLPKNQFVGRGRAESLAAVEEEILERVEEDSMISTR
jgi:transposase